MLVFISYLNLIDTSFYFLHQIKNNFEYTLLRASLKECLTPSESKVDTHSHFPDQITKPLVYDAIIPIFHLLHFLRFSLLIYVSYALLYTMKVRYVHYCGGC